MSPDEKEEYARGFPVHVGVDTAKAFHVMVARGLDRKRTAPQRVDVSREGFEAAHEFFAERFPDVPSDEILVGLEFAGHHGHTFAAFLKQKGYVVVSVLPSVTKKHKEDLDNSPLKTDQKDAALICRLVGEGKFVTFTHLDDTFAKMRSLATQRHRLSVEGVRYRNRLQGLLDVAWPEFADGFTLISAPTPLAILRKWPLPADFASASWPTVRALVERASLGHYSIKKLKELREIAAQSVGMASAPKSRRQEVWDLLERWDLLARQMKAVEEEIVELVLSYGPARALITIPELSYVGAATILSELGALEDYEHHRQILKLAGMNLVGSESGSFKGRRRQSKRGRPLLRKQLFLLATRWCKKKGLFRAQYEALLARNGGTKMKAITALARKLTPLILEIAKTERPFDRERWMRERRLRRTTKG